MGAEGEETKWAKLDWAVDSNIKLIEQMGTVNMMDRTIRVREKNWECCPFKQT